MAGRTTRALTTINAPPGNSRTVSALRMNLRNDGRGTCSRNERVKEFAMCDYSLHNVTSRAAVVADRLVSTRFAGTDTRGFCASAEPKVAVCLRPGTELAFDAEVKRRRLFGLLSASTGQRLARFRQINLGDPNTHHDALEFPDGK